MQRFLRALVAIMLLAIVGVIVVFILENKTKVSISFFTYQTPLISLAVLIVIAFVIGMLITLLLSSLLLMQTKMTLVKTKRQLNACKTELSKQNSTVPL